MADVSTLRMHPLTGELVILAPERSERPNAFDLRGVDPESSCPFCPGNEEETPPEISRIASDDDQWLLRVVPNRYPAVRMESGTGSARGIHEVIVESPDHGGAFERFDPQHATRVVETYVARFEALVATPEIEYVILFKNDGRRAGESIEHPHSQVVALTFVPPLVAAQIARGDMACAMCELLKTIPRDLIVDESETFVTLAPPASRFPFEQWIVPRDHAGSFAAIGRPAIEALARQMQRALRSVRRLEDDAPYNWIFHNAPARSASATAFHWYLEMLPRLTYLAGFELGTGMTINIINPERAAMALRSRIDA